MTYIPAATPFDIPAATLFDNLELAVIALGKRDPVTRNMRPWTRTIARLCGITAPNTLASPRLEALRLLVIALRRRDHSPEMAVSTALGCGFSQDQIECVAAEMAVVARMPTGIAVARIGSPRAPRDVEMHDQRQKTAPCPSVRQASVDDQSARE